MDDSKYVIWFDKLNMTDVASVGGKNASLGEMINELSHAGVKVPSGFATTANAYRDFLSQKIDQGSLAECIEKLLATLDIEDVAALARTGSQIRKWILEAPLPPRLDKEIATAYEKMLKEAGASDISVAVRSSATAEDLADASFAGQQETFLNIHGLDNLLEALALYHY